MRQCSSFLAPKIIGVSRDLSSLMIANLRSIGLATSIKPRDLASLNMVRRIVKGLVEATNHLIAVK